MDDDADASLDRHFLQRLHVDFGEGARGVVCTLRKPGAWPRSQAAPARSFSLLGAAAHRIVAALDGAHDALAAVDLAKEEQGSCALGQGLCALQEVQLGVEGAAVPQVPYLDTRGQDWA